MHLGKHIHSLLKRQTQVHVPGLGSFKRVYSPAAFDEHKGVFMPPVSYIEFDSLSTAGFDVISYFQQVHQWERSQAERVVKEEVSTLLATLDLSGEVTLEGLGQLVSYGNTAIFKPFDLSGFNFEPIESDFPHQTTEEEIPQEPEIDEPVPVAEEIDVLPPILEEEVPVEEAVENTAAEPDAAIEEGIVEDEQSRGRSSVYVMIAVLALFALGGVYYFTQYKNKPNPTQESANLQQDSLSNASNLDAVDTSVNNLVVADTAQVDTLSIALPAEDIVDSVEDNKKFTIVIGTHRTLAKAYEEAEAFNKDGHKTVRVVTPNLAKNLKRVIWDTYATKAERDSALQYVRKHIKTDAWPDVLK